MISADGAIKVADFGIAKLIGPGTSSSGLVVGTPSYMSPEQVLSRPVDARSDLFSVGCTLYEVLTGEKAFPGDTATAVMYKIVHEAPARPAGLRPGIDPGLEQVVLKALANDPDDRFSTCRDMAKALEDCVAGYRGERAGSSPAIVVPVVQPVGPSVRGGDGDRVAERRQSVRPRKTWAANSVVGLAVALGIVVLIGAAGILARRPVPTQPPGRRSASAVEIAAEPAASAPVVTPPPAAEATKAETKISRHEAPPRAQAPVVSRSAAPLKAAAPAVTPLSTPSPRPAAAPDSVETFEALMLRGDVAFQQSAYDTALASYLKANRLKPGDPAVRRKLKVVLTLLGRPAEALNYR
jgi:hypothetical protein